MISKFMNLDIEKRDRIINAALKEFAQKGYKNASTNEIVKKANISKGLLFHYFNNKKGLFLFLYDFTKDIFLNEFYSRIDYNETDILNRCRQIALLKIRLIQKNPELYNFLLNSVTEDSSEVKNELDERNKDILEDGYKKLFENIETSGFKKGLDEKRVSEIILWVVQGFGNRELEKLRQNSDYKSNFDYNAVMAEFDEYIELLKNTFYQ